MRFAQSVLRGLAWSFAEVWTGQALQLLVFLLLARLLDAEAFGLVALASVFTAFVNILIDQGFADAIVQRAELSPTHLDTAFWVNTATAAAMASLGALAAPLLSHLFDEPRLTAVLSVLCLTFFISALGGVQRAILRRNLDFQNLAIRTLVATLVGGGVGIFLALAGFGVWSLVGQILTGSLTGTAYLWIASEWRPKFRFDSGSFRELLDFGLKIVAGRILQFFNTRADKLIVGYFLGTTQLGYYTIGYTLFTRSIDLLRTASTRVAFPMFSRLQGEPETLIRYFYRATGMVSLVAYPFFTLLIVSGPDFVEIFFGSKWQSSAPILQILSIAGFSMSTLVFAAVALQAMGFPGRLLTLGTLTTIVRIAGFLLLVHFGILYVALAFVLSIYGTIPFYFRSLQKVLDIRFSTFYRSISAPFIGALILALVFMLLQHLTGDLLSLHPRFFLSAAVALVCYLAFVHVSSPHYASQILSYARLILPRRGRDSQERG